MLCDTKHFQSIFIGAVAEAFSQKHLNMGYQMFTTKLDCSNALYMAPSVKSLRASVSLIHSSKAADIAKLKKYTRFQEQLNASMVVSVLKQAVPWTLLKKSHMEPRALNNNQPNVPFLSKVV